MGLRNEGLLSGLKIVLLVPVYWLLLFTVGGTTRPGLWWEWDDDGWGGYVTVRNGCRRLGTPPVASQDPSRTH